MSSTQRAPSAPVWAQLGALPERVNMAQFLVERARQAPDALAIRVARTVADQVTFADTTYGELDADSGALAASLAAAGVRPGSRVSVFVRPGVELIAITFALLRIGAVPVLIDPGMGPKNVLACVERMAPEAFIGIPAAHLIRRLRPKAFRSVTLEVVASGRGGKLLSKLSGAYHIDSLRERGRYLDAPLRETPRDDPAAILFTSGSTGPPKGVVYTHGMFEAQVRALKALYGIEPGEIDVACLPVFALFGPALGMTSVFPELDPSKPATCDPRSLCRTIQAAGATTTFGSPAIWRRVVPWCLEHGESLPTLRRVLIAGAPVPTALIADFQSLLHEGADVFTPFGATECLPVSSAAGRELVARGAGSIRARAESGAGTCVGRLAPGIELRLIGVTDETLDKWDSAGELPIVPGTKSALGEIVVRGPVVTREYHSEPDQTAAAKIPVDPHEAHDEGEVWHRIGDVGYVDADGQLWFTGRKSHRLETRSGLVMPVPIENVFNTHPAVFRSALVGLGARGEERQVLIVQLESGKKPGAALATELFLHGDPFPTCAGVAALVFRDDFPVDVRHNAKIHRGELKVWVANTSGLFWREGSR